MLVPKYDKNIDQGLLKDKLLLKREIALTSVSRDDTGPAVSGRRPIIVTFENFK